MQTKIVKKLVGNVDKEFVKKAIDLLSSFYALVRRRGFSTPYLVDVYFYENKEKALRFLELEAFRRGVRVLSIYPAMHEAWSGLPRIHLIVNELKAIDDHSRRSIILHEATHSVLHSGVKYYVVSLPSNSDLAKCERDFLAKALSLSAAIVKDFEVFRLLRDLGLENEIMCYATFTSKELSSVGCNDVEQALNLTKLLAPLAFIKREELPKDYVQRFDRRCEKISLEILNMLRDIFDEGEDFDEMVIKLIKKVLRILEVKC